MLNVQIKRKKRRIKTLRLCSLAPLREMVKGKTDVFKWKLTKRQGAVCVILLPSHP